MFKQQQSRQYSDGRRRPRCVAALFATSLIAVLLLTKHVPAAVVEGRVLEADAKTATFVTPFSYEPTKGDAVEIVDDVDGLGNEIQVADGKVSAYDCCSVTATLEHMSGKVSAGQRVRIHASGPTADASPTPVAASEPQPDPQLEPAPQTSVPEPQREPGWRSPA